MTTSRRILLSALSALVLVGISIAAIAGTVFDATGVSSAALGSVLVFGWLGVLETRRHTGADDTQSKSREADPATQFKDDFLAIVSHELRTPLNAIVGWTYALKRGMLTGRDRDRAIDAVERNAAVMTRLVNDLLDVSRLVQGRLQLSVAPLDLRDIARSAVDRLTAATSAKRLTVTMRLDHDEVPVTGDVARLQQVAWHLLSNAVRFTPAGGSITVEVWRLGSRARLRITDSGEGIDPDVLPHVFESFQRTRQIGRTGLGVGLAIVHHLAELHGGTVDAESAGRGHGATFTLTLPLGSCSAQPGAKATSGRRTHASLHRVR